MYGDATGARMVLGALGGAARRPSEPFPEAAEARPALPLPPLSANVKRAPCRNGARDAKRHKVDGKWIKTDDHCGGRECNRGRLACACSCPGCSDSESDGCTNLATLGPDNPLGLCSVCLAYYKALKPVPREPREHVPDYEKDPALCHHGQRRGECCSCKDWERR